MADLTITRDGNIEIATYHANVAPEIGDTLHCDAFDQHDGEHVAQHSVHYVAQRRVEPDAIVSVLSLEAGTTITVISPAPPAE